MTARDRHSIGFAAFAVAASVVIALGGRPDRAVELVVLGGLVVVAGLPHGALDPLVARRAGLVDGPASSASYLGAYVVVAGVAAGLWLAFPEAGLVTFLMMSGWHFAGDWGDLDRATRGLGGAFVIAGPVLFHPDEVAELFGALSTDGFATGLVETMRPVAVVAALALTALALRDVVRRRLRAVELVALVVAAWALPPLLFFVAYFCGLHSPRHIAEVLRGLAVRGRAALRVGAAFTLLTVVAVAPAALWLDGSVSDRTVQIVFVALGALTVPHMITTRVADRIPDPTPPPIR